MKNSSCNDCREYDRASRTCHADHFQYFSNGESFCSFFNGRDDSKTRFCKFVSDIDAMIDALLFHNDRIDMWEFRESNGTVHYFKSRNDAEAFVESWLMELVK